MNPTLSEEDLLEIEHQLPHGLEEGDVVLFRSPGHDRILAHRIAGSVPGGFLTRGDNCDGEDPWALERSDIIGKVVATRRGTGVRPVSGGRRGRRRAGLLRLRVMFLRVLVRFFRLPYRALSFSGLFSLVMPRGLRPRLVRYGEGERSVLRIQVGRHAVGRYDTEGREWKIRHPWRPLVPGNLLAPPSPAAAGGDGRGNGRK